MDREALRFSVDARGRRVPRRLAAPFMARQRLLRLADHAAAIRRELGEMAAIAQYEPTMTRLPMDRLYELLDETASILAEDAPAVPCRCLGPQGCDLCGGKQWLTARDLRRLFGSAPTASLLVK